MTDANNAAPGDQRAVEMIARVIWKWSGGWEDWIPECANEIAALPLPAQSAPVAWRIGTPTGYVRDIWDNKDEAEREADGYWKGRIEPLYASPPAQSARQGIEKSISVSEYLRDYEFRGEGGDYTPTDAEKELIEDAIEGYLTTLVGNMNLLGWVSGESKRREAQPPSAPPAQSARQGIATEVENYARWTILEDNTKDMLNRVVAALRAAQPPSAPLPVAGETSQQSATERGSPDAG